MNHQSMQPRAARTTYEGVCTVHATIPHMQSIEGKPYPVPGSDMVETVALCGWPLIGDAVNEVETVLLQSPDAIDCSKCLALADRVHEVAMKL